MNSTPQQDPPATNNRPSTPPDEVLTETVGAPTVDSQALLRGGNVAYILHNGEMYRLRVTKQGKLILTK